MQAYMKSTMPYRGVPAPALRAICREAFAAPRLATVAAWRATVLELWRHAARLSPLSQREALQNVHASHAAQTR